MTRPYTTDAVVTTGDQLDRRLAMPLSCRLMGYHRSSVSSLALPAAAQRPRLRSSPPAAALGVTMPSEALVAPWTPGLPEPVAPQHRAPDAVMMAASLDAANWSFRSQNLTVMGLSCQFDSLTPEDGWNGTLQSGFCRWSNSCRMERVGVCWTLVRTVELPPKTGRAQVSRPSLL